MFAGMLVIQARRYDGYSKELEKVRAELAAEREQREALRDQMVYYESDAYVEQLARDQLGFVRPDEIVFINTAD